MQIEMMRFQAAQLLESKRISENHEHAAEPVETVTGYGELDSGVLYGRGVSQMNRPITSFRLNYLPH
jgi:hypothetical protein